MYFLKSLLGLLGLLALVSSQGFAALYVVPTANTSAEGNSSDDAPLGVSGQRFQQVFSSALLSAFPAGSQILGLGLRVNGGETALPAQTVTTFDIWIGQSLNAPGSLSATFANNRGAGDLVRQGPLVISAGDFPGGATPNGFGVIPFDIPYEYTGGDLLIEIGYQGFSAGRNADAIYPFTASQAQTAFGSGYSSLTANVGLYNEAIVFAFDLEPLAPVPEPAETGLLAMGVLATGIILHHFRKHRLQGLRSAD